MNNNNKQIMTRDVTAPRRVTDSDSSSQITTSNLKKRAFTPLLSQFFSLFLFRYKIVTSQSSPSF